MRRHDKRLIPLLVGVFVATFSFAFLTNHLKTRSVDAANLANFKPGNIISDYTMSNYNSMTLEEIQSFLTSKNACSNRDYNYYLTLTRTYPDISWHWENNHFVCLSEERFGDGTVIGEGKTAAQIIYETAQEYKINPQVLIVLIEKESSLITDPIPNNRDYRTMTGFGCPDTAPCDSQYFGFKNQIRKAAWLFREVLDGGWTNYPLGENYIQYNPNASCGGSVVNIENLATSALYRYTPYQPNAGTLAAGTGTAYCGAYGNRNFYIYFNDWFGDPTETYKNIKIADGVYYIISAADGTKAIDIEAAANINGTNVQLYDLNKTNAQKWQITYNKKTDDYTIINPISERALDVNAAGVDNGANIQIWDANGTCAQRWKIVDMGGKNISLVSACSGKVISIAGGVTEKKANIQLWTLGEKMTQRWSLTPVSVVEDGLYTIKLNSDINRAMDISGGSYNAKAGANVQIWTNNNTGAQRWQIKKDTKDEGYYVITNLQSNKVIDISAGSVLNGANIQAWNYNDTCAQKWQMLKNDDDSYTFISACSNKVIESTNSNSGSNIQINEANNGKNQQWVIEKIELVDDGEYQIVSKLSERKVIDLAGNNSANGTNIQLYDLNNTTAQNWKIEYDKENDYYTVSNPGTLKVLDVAAAGTSAGTNIHSWEENGTCAQKWTIYSVEDDYSFLSACSGLAIDVSAANTINGTNIQLWTQNGTLAQQWSLIPLL